MNKPASEPVTIRILDREYTVGCEPDERDGLMAAAKLLDAKMREIRGGNRMGLRKLRQVFALPRDAIVRRFPPAVLQHLDAIRGGLVAPLRCYLPPDHFEGRIEFDAEVESSQALLFPLRRLAQDLAAFLAGRDGGVQRYTLVLEHERCDDSEVHVGLLTPQREANMGGRCRSPAW